MYTTAGIPAAGIYPVNHFSPAQADPEVSGGAGRFLLGIQLAVMVPVILISLANGEG